MADVIHLSLTGIKGESTNARHRDEIIVESWNWSVAAPSAATGVAASAGKPAFAPFSFAHRADTASAPLWRACATGQHIAEGDTQRRAADVQRRRLHLAAHERCRHNFDRDG
jgi:type VI secretion system secreted protein Hcp